MRPDFPYEFTEKQKAAMLPYGQHLGEISELVEWLRYSILYENREEFRRNLDDLRHQLTRLEALFSPNPESPGAKS
jgi:hypothetical protein